MIEDELSKSIITNRLRYRRGTARQR